MEWVYTKKTLGIILLWTWLHTECVCSQCYIISTSCKVIIFHWCVLAVRNYPWATFWEAGNFWVFQNSLIHLLECWWTESGLSQLQCALQFLGRFTSEIFDGVNKFQVEVSKKVCFFSLMFLNVLGVMLVNPFFEALCWLQGF